MDNLVFIFKQDAVGMDLKILAPGSPIISIFVIYCFISMDHDHLHHLIINKSGCIYND